jgi:hypothetical protein
VEDAAFAISMKRFLTELEDAMGIINEEVWS